MTRVLRVRAKVVEDEGEIGPPLHDFYLQIGNHVAENAGRKLLCWEPVFV